MSVQAAAHQLSPSQVLDDDILTAQPVERLIEPDEVAERASYLVDPHGRSCAGVPLSTDQGRTAR